MKTTVKIEKEVDIKTLEVEANVRYWEDSNINGVDDELGDLTPAKLKIGKPIFRILKTMNINNSHTTINENI